MGFTTPCFIRKNTPELRKKLEELRYKLLNSGDTTLDAHNYDGKGSHKRHVIRGYGVLILKNKYRAGAVYTYAVSGLCGY